MFPPNSESAVKPRAAWTSSEKVIVAVKAEKVISKIALAWALAHVVRPGDFVTLLAVFSGRKKGGRKLWSLPRLNGDCRKDNQSKLPDRICQISESCSQMVLQFHNQIEVVVHIKVVPGAPAGVVAAEAKNNAANWVVLDKKLKQERRHCMEELHCNIVVMMGSKPKVLRLNLACSVDLQTPFFSASSSPVMKAEKLQGHRVKHSTPVSSPEEQITSHTESSEEILLSNAGAVSSVFLVYEQNPLFEGLVRGRQKQNNNLNDLGDKISGLDSCGERIITLSSVPKSYATSKSDRILWIPENDSLLSSDSKRTQKLEVSPCRNYNDEIFVEPVLNQNYNRDVFSSSIREAVSLGRTSSAPPPLCSLCQYRSPAFGKPPRRFHYWELLEATNGFSDSNFLSEGGFGLVHRGALKEGLVIAVKQLKLGGPQRDADFCREVRVLSCAQHRNVVLLVGFCIEGNKRALVYEYICNGSLDFHLHGNKRTCLDLQSRLKIAIGTARGLRYLHEDCRVGCIVHRDMRPKNILLTHDFEPLVADFGLVSFLTEWDRFAEDQAVGTSRYLAPECFEGTAITERFDVYAFGLVLLELITGRRTFDLKGHKAHDFLEEIFHPLSALEPIHLIARKYRLLDVGLQLHGLQNLPRELHAIGSAASLCLQKDPESRSSMSKVLKILEAGNGTEPMKLDINSAGNTSGHMQCLVSSARAQVEPRGRHSRRLSY